MRILSLLLVLFLITPCYAGTLVKYDKKTGNIIQTNDGLDKIPSEEILYDRYISGTTDVIFVEGSVDITKQRVDKDTKSLVDIPQAELEAKEKIIKEKEKKKKEDRQKAIDKLKVLGFEEDELDALFR